MSVVRSSWFEITKGCYLVQRGLANGKGCDNVAQKVLYKYKNNNNDLCVLIISYF